MTATAMTQALQGRARFGAFELDPRAGELHRDGRSVVLQEQQLKVLLMLIGHEGEISTREEIKKKLWPKDTVVEFDYGINNTIKNLRRALGDSADAPSYIATIKGRGYRLMVPVQWTGVAECVPADSGEESPAALSSRAERSGVEGPAVDDSGSLSKAMLKVGRLTGKVVSHYRVLEVIGGGGMGLVYRAEDLKLGRAVALKFLPEEVGDDPKARERFDREARAVSALSHPNICPIYEFAEHDGQPFIAMELLQGKTLRDHLADGRFRLTQPEGLEIAIQIATGLEAAHEKGIIHRDIKPANIFITERNVAKILDFGVAKMIQLTENPHPGNSSRNGAPDLPSSAVILSDDAELREGEESKDPYSDRDAGIEVPSASSGQALRLRSSADAGLTSLRMTNETGEAAASPKGISLTGTGAQLGTAGYMSPEQIRGEPLDARTDIFSFGLVLYEMATRERAFFGETEAILHDAIQHREPKPVSELAPEIPHSLETLIGKCLAKERERRYEAVWELANDLREAQQANLPATVSIAEKDGKSSPHRRRRFVVAAIALLLMTVVAAPIYRRFRPVSTLTAKRTIVLAHFENKTADKTFDQTLHMALSYALIQTPALNLLSHDKVKKSREALGIAEQTMFSADQAMQVCKYTKSSAVLDGSISDSGNNYRIDMQATDCATGAILAKSSAEASEREQVVHSLGIAAHDLRKKLGEASETLREFDQPLELATTSSLEALQMIAEYDNKMGSPEAIPALKRAVELDPQCAIAHVELGTAYFDVLQNRLAAQEYKRAYDLRDRADAYSRLSIEQSYFSGTGQLELSIETLKRERQLYATTVVSNDLSVYYRYLGALEASREEAERAVRDFPRAPFAYINLSNAYIMLGRLDQAQHVLDEASTNNLQSRWLDLTRYWLAFLNRDFDGMQKEVAKARNHPGAEDLLLYMQANTEAYFGRVKSARRYKGEAVASTMKSEKFMAGFYLASAAMGDAEVGYSQRAISAAKRVIGPDAEPEALKMAGLALARSGEVNSAEQIISRLNDEAPLNTLTQKYHIPIIQAAIDLQRNNPAKAVADLQISIPYELGGTDPAYLYPAYMRGLAYLQLGKGPDAAREFQKLIDHPGIVQTLVIGALAHLQLARAYALMGDKDAERKSYQDFLTLWKDADPDIPVYKQAKAEYAKLNKLSAASHQLPAKGSQLAAVRHQ